MGKFQKSSIKNFVHTIVLAVQDVTNILVPQTEVSIKLDIQVQDSLVTIKIPALNFQLPTEGTITTVSGQLPKKIRPTDAVYSSNTLEADQTATGYDIYIGNDGSLRIVGKGDSPIPVGPLITHAKTITYLVTKICFKSPKNFIIGQTFSTPSKMNFAPFGEPLEFLDFYETVIFNNNLYSAWADNSQAIPPAFGASMMFRHGVLKEKHGKTKVKFDEIKTLFTPTGNADIAEYSLSVNPTDPNNIIIGGNYITLDEPLPQNQIQIIRAVSFDNGQNFTVGRIDNMNGYPASDGDQGFLFDTFGNCWVISLTGRPPNYFPNDVSIGVSIDGGLTFRLVKSFLSDPNAVFGYDYPNPAFGGDGNGGFAFYFTVDYIDDFGNVIPNIGFIPVTGKNSFGPVTIVPLTQFTNIVDIFNPYVSNDGKIFIVGTNCSISTFTPINFVQLVSHPGGLANIVDGSFSGPWDIAQENFGGATATSAGFPINFTPGRGVYPDTRFPSVYDDTIGRLYVLYADIQPQFSQNMDLLLLFSDNNGQSWQGPLKINDVDTQNRCFQSMSRDPKTGNFFFTFYDCRNDPTSFSGQYFGAIVSASQLPKETNSIHGNLRPLSPLKSNLNKVSATPNREIPKAVIRRSLRRRISGKSQP